MLFYLVCYYISILCGENIEFDFVVKSSDKFYEKIIIFGIFIEKQKEKRSLVWVTRQLKTDKKNKPQ